MLSAEERSSSSSQFHWQQLAPLPESRGVAAPFAGVDGQTLLVGGGANFPDKMPWEGGEKIWYDRVWALRAADTSWTEVGRLSRPLAYGVSVSAADGIVCVGGSNAEKHYADVFMLSMREGNLVSQRLPALPSPVANACGALVGNMLFIAGGTKSPDSIHALKSFYALDLGVQQPQWKELESWPGPPRMLAVAAAQGGSFFLISGAELIAGDDGKPKRRYLTDAYRFAPGAGWTRIADVPRPVVAAPSPAPTVGPSHFLVIGGDDGSKVGSPPQDHPGFPSTILAYHTVTDTWTELGRTPAPRVTTPTVQWGRQWVVVSGEQRPGVRSPEVWSLRSEPRK